MRIAFSGVQCTGKTTLINAMQKMPEFKNYQIIRESIRSLKAKGYQINEDGNDDTQLAVMNAHIMNLIPEDTIIDRCSLDGLCYGEYSYNHGKVSEDTLNFCKKVWELTKEEYDLIFYLRPEFDMVEDGTRSTNEDFRNETLEIFDKYIQQKLDEDEDMHYILSSTLYGQELPTSNIVMISGTVEERLNQIIEAINKLTEE